MKKTSILTGSLRAHEIYNGVYATEEDGWITDFGFCFVRFTDRTIYIIDEHTDLRRANLTKAIGDKSGWLGEDSGKLGRFIFDEDVKLPLNIPV